MDDDKFEKLMNEMREIQKAQRQTDDKLSSSLQELRKEVNTAQEKTAKDLSQKITKSGYTFQKKGHEHQFTFNSGMQESISSARSELEKLAADPSDKDSLAKATPVWMKVRRPCIKGRNTS